MKKSLFFWIDAFTNQRFGGNPCAVILGADGLTTEEMQTIAQEMNLSETAFVLTSTRADFRARYFTPQEELPFAGHPTIATVHTLIQAKYFNAVEAPAKLTLELKAGIVLVAPHCTGHFSYVKRGPACSSKSTPPANESSHPSLKRRSSKNSAAERRLTS